MLDLSGEMVWRPKIVPTVATRGEGIDELWSAVEEHREFQERTGRLEQRRTARLRDELRNIVLARLREQAEATCSGDHFEKLVAQVAARELDPYAAARELLGG
jgi:LAO/AO transport system kinase